MSLSSPVEKVDNPISTYIIWNGNLGAMSYVHQGSDGKSELKEFSLPFEAIVLDCDIACIRGKAVDGARRVNSNLVSMRPTSSRTFEVKYSDGEPLAKGEWKDIKSIVKGKEKYAAWNMCVYLFTANKKTICLYVKGRMISPFKLVQPSVVELGLKLRIGAGSKEIIDPDGNSYVPNFEIGSKITEEELAVAVNADKALQEYLTFRFSGKKEEEGDSANNIVDDIPATALDTTDESQWDTLLEDYLQRASGVLNIDAAVNFWKEAAINMENADVPGNKSLEVMDALQNRLDGLYTIGKYRVKPEGTIFDTVPSSMEASSAPVSAPPPAPADDLPF